MPQGNVYVLHIHPQEKSFKLYPVGLLNKAKGHSLSEKSLSSLEESSVQPFEEKAARTHKIKPQRYETFHGHQKEVQDVGKLQALIRLSLLSAGQ